MVPTRRLWSALLLIPTVFCLSCAVEKIGNVDPETVRQVHHLIYSDATGETIASSTLTVGSAGIGGTQLELDGSSASLLDNGEELRKDTILGAAYVKTFPGFVTDHVLKFTDTRGKVFENKATITKIDFDELPPVIHRSEMIKIHFSGSPMAEKESISLRFHIFSGTSNKDVYVPVASVGDNFVTIIAATFKDIAAGEMLVHWMREKTEDLTEATERGGSKITTYLTKERKITLAD